MNALAQGGNAVDAAVAAALTLGVVDSHNSGIGGGCFMLVKQGDLVVAIDGREMAPAAAHRDMYLRDGKAVSELSRTGALAIGIPGSLKAYEYALAELGELPMAELLRNAAELADGGFPVDATLVARLKRTRDKLAKFPPAAAIYLKADGSPYGEGETLVQRDLAASMRGIAEQGTDWFYGGKFAEYAESWMRKNGGIARRADFANYRIRLRKPVVSTYRGKTVYGFGPPSSGGVHVAQVLNVLEEFDLEKLRATPGLREHVIAEAMKLAFADRAYWLGDPDFVDVPAGLSDSEYAKSLAKRIKLDQVISVPGHGTPPRVDDWLFDKHTTHVAAADADGNWVAITTTLNTSFGSGVVIPGTGILMNNQMDDFSAQPGVPNAYGLVGAEANAIAPGKRPLSSMSPTIVTNADGSPLMTLGAAGGPTIITQVLQAIINVVDHGMAVDAALAQPRIHHQWKPDSLRIEKALPGKTRTGLERRGHKLNDSRATFGATQAIQMLPGGRFLPAHDPRIPGAAATR
jgi:gamma-glutamyltranspeptidase/glutathione hydrolase